MRKFNLLLIFSLAGLCLIRYQARAQDFAYVPPPLQQNDESDRKALTEVLTSLEKKFGIYFSFESEVVQNKYIRDGIKLTDDLEQTLMNVLNPVNLNFRKISDKFYTIYPGGERRNDRKVKRDGGSLQSMDSGIRPFFSTSTS